MSVFFRRRGKAFVIDDNFANNSWGTIIEVCQRGIVPNSWAVGDSKMMTIDGKDYQIDIIGKNHDTYYTSGGTAPLTFQMHDCYDTGYDMVDDDNSNYNGGGWHACEMRITHLPAILALMPMEVKEGIRRVNKLTSEGNKSTTLINSADSLFLLSEIEVFGSTTYSVPGEGTQYAYYKAGRSKIKNTNGSANSWWWERSPCATNTHSFCEVDDSGQASRATASSTRSVAFAFCF